MQAKTITGRDINHKPAELSVDRLTWRPGAYGLVFNEQGQILVVENTVNKRYEFPGGGVDIHEPFEAGLIREVWEETGLRVEIDEFILFDDEFFLTPSGRHWHTIKCFYRCHVIHGEMRNTILEEEPLENPQWIAPSILTKDNLTIGWDALKAVESKKFKV